MVSSGHYINFQRHGECKQGPCYFNILNNKFDNWPSRRYIKLEALRERRPPWPRQIITPILLTAKMLSLGGERLPILPTPPKKKKKKKKLDHYLHHDLGMPPLLWWVFFAHLLILEHQDHHQNLISSSLHDQGPLHKISSQPVHNVWAMLSTDRQTNKPTLPKT